MNPKNYTTNSITSKDGTNISYRQLGRGPGLVVVHGTMESAQSHMQLAEALDDTYTVYLPDRRGRGLSGPYSKDHNLRKEVEDMDALLTQTGARLCIRCQRRRYYLPPSSTHSARYSESRLLRTAFDH
ncbi:alpha/beta fold hydrolase [Cohnella kolymensis]|uniref:alpha/beta fold hydrolase n=1 Tax=Cohnella kolymensis TaxID=1590652 RepID=UPI0006962D0C|nr:alpha/beta hydrolase [Cohnella kolymensis]